MKSDIDIKDDVYKVIELSPLVGEVNGTLKKRKRSLGSDREDIVLSVVGNTNGQIQEAFVNVNVYVKDLLEDGQYQEDSSRLRHLCKVFSEFLEKYHGDTFDFWLESQQVFQVNGKDEHVINNRLLYKQNNE